jgi:hypothetical protein
MAGAASYRSAQAVIAEANMALLEITAFYLTVVDT